MQDPPYYVLMNYTNPDETKSKRSTNDSTQEPPKDSYGRIYAAAKGDFASILAEAMLEHNEAMKEIVAEMYTTLIENGMHPLRAAEKVYIDLKTKIYADGADEEHADSSASE